MSYYTNVYQKRLNRFGLDYQSRIQGEREYNFENYLLKTIYRVDFQYGDNYVPASLEHYKQDDSRVISYLLTRRNLILPNGTILDIHSSNGEATLWMVWWLEDVEASGYNRYVVLRMDQEMSWEENGTTYKQWGHFEGPGASKIKDVIRTSSNEAIYAENNNLHLFITPYNSNLKRDSYFEVNYQDSELAYVVTEIDIISTPGVEYVTVDPTFIRNKDEKPIQQVGEESSEFFWLNGGG